MGVIAVVIVAPLLPLVGDGLKHPLLEQPERAVVGVAEPSTGFDDFVEDGLEPGAPGHGPQDRAHRVLLLEQLVDALGQVCVADARFCHAHTLRQPVGDRARAGSVRRVTTDLTDVEDRLYGADLDAFVRERTAAAKELRGEGKRAEAAAAAKLAKPSVAAWIVNRVARDTPDLVGELLDAGASLREVQLGAGSAADLRTAAEAQEAALRAVMRQAEKVAADRGSAAGGTLDRVRETLHAAALDADLAEQVRRGVLVREQRAVGFPAGIAIPAERRRPAPAKRGAATPAPKPAKAQAKAKAPPQQRDEVAAKRLERAAAAAQTAQEGLAGAEADRDAAQRALEATTEELAAARRSVAELSQRVEAGRRAVDRAEKAHAKTAKQAQQALDRLQALEP